MNHDMALHVIHCVYQALLSQKQFGDFIKLNVFSLEVLILFIDLLAEKCHLASNPSTPSAPNDFEKKNYHKNINEKYCFNLFLFEPSANYSFWQSAFFFSTVSFIYFIAEHMLTSSYLSRNHKLYFKMFRQWLRRCNFRAVFLDQWMS